MREMETVHDDHGATYTERGGRRIVAHYGRPDRTHRAVRNVVGVTQRSHDVLKLTGEDRVEYVDNAVSNVVPQDDGEGVYALLLDPQGRVETDMYVYNAGERLLVMLPPGEGEPLAAEWREKTFIQDVAIETATDELAIFGVYGPNATEKVASVCTVGTPVEPLTFVRARMDEAGVTVIRDDGLTGEEGYEVVCRTADAARVFDTLANRGLNAAPFGYRTWESLTLEAGTPLFETELAGRLPNDLGLDTAVDYEKGCFVGQEVVSRVENRGTPSKRLVGLEPEVVPENTATVFDGDSTVGEVTRALESPVLETPVALALVDFDLETTALTVRVDGTAHEARLVDVPFVEGSAVSARLPAGR